MEKLIAIIALAALIAIPFPVNAAGEHNEGTNVNHNGTIYRIENGTKTPYTSAGAFLSYKFNSWINVVNANPSDILLPNTKLPNSTNNRYIIPRPGSLVNDKGTVYQITGEYSRAGFTSEAVFNGMGYSFNNVYPGDTSFMITDVPINSSTQRHPAGTLVNYNGTIYIMAGAVRVGIPSMAALDSWGYWLNDAVIANSFDIAASDFGTLQIRQNSEMTVFDSVLFTPIPVDDPTFGWYSTNIIDDGIRFSVKYPSDWKRVTDDYLFSYIGFRPESGHEALLWDITPNSIQARTKQTVINDIKADHVNDELLESTTNLKDGVATILEFTSDDSDYYERYLIIQVGNNVYTLHEQNTSDDIEYSFVDFYNTFDAE